MYVLQVKGPDDWEWSDIYMAPQAKSEMEARAILYQAQQRIQAMDVLESDCKFQVIQR